MGHSRARYSPSPVSLPPCAVEGDIQIRTNHPVCCYTCPSHCSPCVFSCSPGEYPTNASICKNWHLVAAWRLARLLRASPTIHHPLLSHCALAAPARSPRFVCLPLLDHQLPEGTSTASGGARRLLILLPGICDKMLTEQRGELYIDVKPFLLHAVRES